MVTQTLGLYKSVMMHFYSRFLVDVCKYLEIHADTEGLFRKSGSVVRQKLLKVIFLTGNQVCINVKSCKRLQIFIRVSRLVSFL